MQSKELQRKFFDSLRTGREDNFPEVQHSFYLYHKHLKKKLSTLLINCFPLTQEIVGEEKWETLIAHFLANAATPTEGPLSLCQAFYCYLLAHIPSIKDAAKHLRDVVIFEYILIDLFYMENLPHVNYSLNGNRLESPLVLNPEHRLVCLDYPVFQNTKFLEQKNAHYLFMYRHPTLFTVEFIEISALYYNALQQLAIQPISILTAIENAASACSVNINDVDMHEILDFVTELQEHGAIFGFAFQ
ncbi:MAG: putative DNA-binding domain-containing protein [Parachlamydiaceae bacterium]|nr:putative DNA-binding domain-containing protein [Parachlamydiaceae bacterium]